MKLNRIFNSFLVVLLIITLSSCGKANNKDNVIVQYTPSPSMESTQTKEAESNTKMVEMVSASDLQDYLETEMNSVIDYLSKSQDEVLNSLDGDFSDYDKNYSKVTGWYELADTESQKLYDLIFEQVASSYRIIAENANNNDNWSNQIDDTYAVADDVLDDFYDKLDDLYNNAYDVMDEKLSDYYDSVDYSTWSDAWDKMYSDWSTAWGEMFSNWGDQWSILMNSNTEVWASISRGESVDVDMIMAEAKKKSAGNNGEDTAKENEEVADKENGELAVASVDETDDQKSDGLTMPDIEVDPDAILKGIGGNANDIFQSLSGKVTNLLSAVTAGGYEDIYNDYSKRIKDAGEKKLEEYKSDAAANTKGIEGLAEIANEKVEDLAEIEVEGTEAMAQFMYTKGAGNYSEYEEWASKLYEVYQTESMKIYDAYMASY